MNPTHPPATEAEAVQRLKQASIPEAIVGVARRLHGAGYQAVLVGGCVRDTLLGLPVDDWDVASSATPSEVQALFRRTIPTGIEHGTITVLIPLRPGEPGEPVEVTTFRGEGEYVDGRRPASVEFHRDLHDDLARRDFTVNALAWDPVERIFADPFGGLADLQARILRAVGRAIDRFSEDGLRTMRAVRFCATRALILDPETEAAIAPTLSVLDRVSRERVYVEFMKLLAAPMPSLGLRPMVRTGLWPHVVADVPAPSLDRAIDSVDRLRPDPLLRLARLFLPLAERGAVERDGAIGSFERLKPSKAERQRLAALLSEAGHALARADGPVPIRLAASRLGREHVHDVIGIYELEPDAAQRIVDAIDQRPLTIKELAITGRDLVAAAVVEPGPRLGAVLEALLRAVIEDAVVNERDRLIAWAKSQCT